MDKGIGTILREARERRQVELAEVEAATRIRPRYLRAIENEEWDVLPGGVYARGFIRTYATFLSLDGERLADDFRRDVEGWSRGIGSPPLAPSGPAASSSSRFQLPPRLGAGLAVAAVLLVAVIAIVATSGGGGEDQGSSAGESGHAAVGQEKPAANRASGPQVRGVSMQLAADAEVWVCLLDARGRPLVDGQILEAGAEEGPFRSGSFTVSFGNGEVSVLIDGREADIPATSSPIGYSVDSSGELTELSETERPTCT